MGFSTTAPKGTTTKPHNSSPLGFFRSISILSTIFTTRVSYTFTSDDQRQERLQLVPRCRVLQSDRTEAMIRHNNDSRSSDSDDDGSDQTHHEGPQEEAGDNAAMPSSYLVAATTTGVSTLAGLSALPLHHSHLDPSFAPSRTVLEGLTRNLPTLNSTNPVIFSPPSHFDPVVNSLLQQRFDPLLGARPGVLPFAGISNPLLLHPNQALIGMVEFANNRQHHQHLCSLTPSCSRCITSVR